MSNDRHILIAGGGIGGLTLAVALRQAGIGATVFERAPQLRPVGAGITVQMNAMTALATLGLDQAVLAAGERARHTAVLDASGRTLSGLQMDALESELGITVCIHRARLHQILLEAAGDRAVRLGSEVQDFEDQDPRVTVRLTDGTTATGDLLVGADGLHSRVRAQLLGEAPLRYSGYTSWRGVCANDGLIPSGRVTESWGPGARFGALPIGGGEVYWFCTANAPAGARDPVEGPHAQLQARFGGFHAPIPELIRRTPRERILRTDIHDRPPVDSWSRGRVTLLGDAAHPMTPNLGQGGCQAIEDAVVLARCLTRHPSIATALAAYERARIGRANRIVKQAWSFGRLGQLENRAGIRVRDALLRMTPESFQRRQLRQFLRFELTG